MRLRGLFLSALAALAFVGVDTRAQSQAPQRDGAPVPVGTSSVTGRVTTTDATPRPLRRVKVTLSSGLVTTPRSVLTDDNGVYLFTGLAPGNYTIVATRAGFITGAYGSTRAGSTQGVPVAVVAGQTTSGLDIGLARGAVVTGTVRSASGQPVPDFQVSVVPATGLTIEQLGRQATSTTDDRGIYRVFGLAAGDYVVMARPSNLAALELRRVSAEEVRRAQGAMASSVSLTAPVAGASASAPVATVARAETLTFAPVFHPGTADPAAATIVRVAAGEERAGVDLTTVIVPTARVAGTLVDAEGRPAANTNVNIQSIDGRQAMVMDLGRLSARTNAAGQFATTNVLPGRYRVVARSAPAPAGRSAAPPANASVMELALTMMSEMMGGSGASWAQEDIVVEGRDVDGLALRLQPGMKVSGRIVFDGAAPPPASEVTRSRVMIANVPDRVRMADLANMLSALSLTSFKEDGTFEAGGLAPNQYRVQMMAPGLTIPGLVTASQGTTPAAAPPTWTTKSVMLAGRDVADASFDVRPGEDISGVVITMTDRISEIAGRVIDGAGRPAPGYPIVVFSTDRRYWTFGSRRVQQSRPASDGRYRVSGLPAGEYVRVRRHGGRGAGTLRAGVSRATGGRVVQDHARRRREKDPGHEARVRRVL